MGLLVILIGTQILTSIKDHKTNECKSKPEALYSYNLAKDSTIKGKGWNKEKGKSLKERTRTCRLYLFKVNGIY